MKNKDESQRWLDQAEADYDSAKKVMTTKKYYVVCFLCQQAAEKFLKGYLYKQGQRVLASHSILSLVREATDHEPSFKTLEREAKELDKNYHPTRYPDALPGGIPADVYNELDAKQALKQIEKIRIKVNKHA